MVDSNLIKKIRDLSLGKDSVNKIIADYILKNINEIIDMTTNELARICYVSSASVIRFCNKIDLDGFNELKFKLKYLQKTFKLEAFQFSAINDIKDDQKRFLTEYLRIKQKSTEDMYNYFFSKTNIFEIIEKILKAKSVYIFAFNISYNVSKNFAQRLRWLKINVIHENDISAIESYLSSLTNEDVTICISLTEDIGVINKISLLCKDKCYSLGLLGAQASKLAENFHDHLTVISDEELLWDIYSIRSQTLMQLLDFLYTLIVSKIN